MKYDIMHNRIAYQTGFDNFDGLSTEHMMGIIKEEMRQKVSEHIVTTAIKIKDNEVGGYSTASIEGFFFTAAEFRLFMESMEERFR